jgi:hypothetical protein
MGHPIFRSLDKVNTFWTMHQVSPTPLRRRLILIHFYR